MVAEKSRVFSIFRNVLEDGIDALREAHVQHLVSLIKHHVVHVLQLSHATINQIEQTARGSHDNLHTMLQGANLASDVGTAINSGNMQTVDVLGKTVQVVCYLETKLTCRTEDDSLCLLAAGISLLDHWNTSKMQSYPYPSAPTQSRRSYYQANMGLLLPELALDSQIQALRWHGESPRSRPILQMSSNLFNLNSCIIKWKAEFTLPAMN